MSLFDRFCFLVLSHLAGCPTALCFNFPISSYLYILCVFVSQIFQLSCVYIIYCSYICPNSIVFAFWCSPTWPAVRQPSVFIFLYLPICIFSVCLFHNYFNCHAFILYVVHIYALIRSFLPFGALPLSRLSDSPLFSFSYIFLFVYSLCVCFSKFIV